MTGTFKMFMSHEPKLQSIDVGDRRLPQTQLGLVEAGHPQRHGVLLLTIQHEPEQKMLNATGTQW